MDDLKLCAKTDDNLEGRLSPVKILGDGIVLFSLDKCTKVPFKVSLPLKYKNITVDVSTEITEFKHNKTYKYLGINEANCGKHITNKEKRKEFYWRIKAMSITE